MEICLLSDNGTRTIMIKKTHHRAGVEVAEVATEAGTEVAAVVEVDLAIRTSEFCN